MLAIDTEIEMWIRTNRFGPTECSLVMGFITLSIHVPVVFIHSLIDSFHTRSHTIATTAEFKTTFIIDSLPVFVSEDYWFFFSHFLFSNFFRFVFCVHLNTDLAIFFVPHTCHIHTFNAIDTIFYLIHYVKLLLMAHKNLGRNFMDKYSAKYRNNH